LRTWRSNPATAWQPSRPCQRLDAQRRRSCVLARVHRARSPVEKGIGLRPVRPDRRL